MGVSIESHFKFIASIFSIFLLFSLSSFVFAAVEDSDSATEDTAPEEPPPEPSGGGEDAVTSKPLTYTYDTLLPDEKSFDPHSRYMTDIFTGAATFSYEFKLPPGTHDLKPALFLSYNSHLRRERPGMVGSGWRLNDNYIQRNVNYTTDESSDDFFTLFFNGQSSDLVYVASEDKYHTFIEDDFFDIRQFTNSANNTNGNFWILRTTDGTQYTYGYNPSSELHGTENSLVWRWSLDSIEDTHNNRIFYAYTENPYGDNGTVYLANITYNNDQSRVVELVYETVDRLDTRDFFDNGNKIRELRRLAEIKVFANTALVRRYLLQYLYDYSQMSPGYAPTYSYIANITEFGSDDTTSLPPVYFSYFASETGIPYVNYSIYQINDCSSGGGRGCFINDLYADNGNRLLDVNRDGWLDIVRAPFDNSVEILINNKNHTWILNTTFTYPQCHVDINRTMCFTATNYIDNGVRVADVNNDGFPDLVKASDPVGAPPESYIYLGNGLGWGEESTIFVYPRCNTLTEDMCLARDGLDAGIQLEDVNGDGLPDIIKARTGFNDQNSTIWLNNGHGWNESTTYAYPGCKPNSDNYTCFIHSNDTQHGLDNGVRFADVNGDGLVDIVKAMANTDTSGNATVYLNNGTGWDDGSEGGITPILYLGCANDSAAFCLAHADNNDLGVRLADANGDGLPDIIRGREFGVNPPSIVYYGNGHGWSPTSTSLASCDNGDAYACYVNSNYFDRGTRMADINGDGVADQLVARGINLNLGAITFINRYWQTGLLNTINTSTGGFITLDYKPSTFYDHAGSNDWISDLGFPLSVVDTSIHYNLLNDSHQNAITTTFEYKNGLYDYQKKDFRGFGSVLEVKDNLTYIEHTFYQDEGRKGRELETTINGSDNLIYQRKNSIFSTSFVNNYYTVLLLEENISQFDSQATPKITKTTYDYDIYGNVLAKYSEGDLDITGDERNEYIDFANNTEAWIVNTPIRTSLYDSSNTTLLRETKYFYDGSTTFGGTPTKGDVTKEEKILEGTNTSIIQYTYNAYGNILTKTDPNNRQTTFTYGVQDPTFTFVDTETNPKNHVMKRWYDLGTGNLQSAADANNFLTNYTYDVFGRITAEIKPMDTFTYPTKVYTYEFDGLAPEKTKVQLREQNETGNTLDTYQFIDGLGRIIQTKTEAEKNKQIVEDTFYDTRGLVSSKSNKYFADMDESYIIPNHTVGFTNFTYDALQRPTLILNPDDSQQSFVYDRWLETQYDANNNQKDVRKDAYGQIVQVIEYNPTNYTTDYVYNDAGELITVTDAANNILSFTYDLAGRKRTETDGDIGTKTFTYDSAGNLIQSIDNKGIVTTYTYDELNRPLTKITTSESYTYAYDTITKGTLSSITSANFTRSYDYDERLRVQGDTKVIDGLTYAQNLSYDSMDRPTGKELRDRDAVGFSYTAQGTLDTLTVDRNQHGIVNSTTHTEMSAPFDRLYGSGAVTSYRYNETNFRLQRILTGDKQDLSYIYDNIANVLSITDAIYSRVLTMTYDSLSRLLSTTRYDGADLIFDFAYTYDPIGNMLNVSSVSENYTFFYNGTPTHMPHRITYEVIGDGLVIASLNNLTGGLDTVFEFAINNTESIGMTDISWALHTGVINITSQGNLTLEPREDMLVYVNYIYGSSGTYPIVVTVAGLGNGTDITFTDNQTMSMMVP